MRRAKVPIRVALPIFVSVLITTVFAGAAGATQRYLELSAAGAGSIVFSADGSKRFITTTEALVPTDTNGQSDIYLEENGQVTLVPSGTTGGAGILGVSADGTHVVFATRESLVAADTDTALDFYMWSPGQLELVSKEPPGSGLNFAPPSGQPFFLGLDAISQDGAHVYFHQRNGVQSVSDFVEYSSSTQATVLVVRGDPATMFCGSSLDGSKAVFRVGGNLDPADTDSGYPGADVYLFTNGGQPTLLSAGSNGNNYVASCAGMSADASKVFFTTNEQLVPQDTNGVGDIYERANGQTTLITTGASGGSAQGVSPDGSAVLLTTRDSLVAADTDSQLDVYRWSGGQMTLLSSGPAGGNGPFDILFVLGASRDLSVVYFRTQEALVAADTNSEQDFYENIGGQTVLVPLPAAWSFSGIVPGPGDLVLSTDTSLVPGDTDSQVDTYDWNGSAFSVVSPGNGAFDATPLAFNDDGTRIAFRTAESLLSADTDDQPDVYVARPVPPDSGGGPVSAGGTVSTGTTPTPADPLETSVTSPSAGTITITEGEASGAPPAGFQTLGIQAVISVNVAPSPTAAQPLTVVFSLDGSLLAPAGLDYTNVQVLKDGALVPACTTSTPANPDPCVSSRASLSGGGAAITVRTSGASTWKFGKPSDSTPPVVTPTVTGTAGSNGWYRSDVGVSWSVVDPDTPVTSSSGCGSTVLSTDSAGTTYTCAATSGGGTTAKSVTVKRDATAPTVTFASHPASYAVDETVSIGCSATDNLSGIDTNCRSINSAAYLFQVGSNTVSSNATDNAGNTGNGSATFSVQVTTASLCALTRGLVQSSAKYATLSQGQKSGVDAKVNAACQDLAQITPKTSAKQKASLIAEYKDVLSALTQQGVLTPAQADLLGSLAGKL